MNVIEGSFPERNYYIDVLGSAWAVYYDEPGQRVQMKVFTTLDQANDYIYEVRKAKK